MRAREEGRDRLGVGEAQEGEGGEWEHKQQGG